MEISGGINQLLESLNQIHVTNEADKGLIEEIKEDLRNNEIADAMKKLQVFNSRRENDEDVDEEEFEVEEKPKKQGKSKNKESDISEESTYPKELQNDKLERTYLGLLLNNPKSISMYYFVYDECLFDNENFINIYKGVLFTEGAKYSSEQAKRNFNFGKVTKEIMDLKEELKYETDGEFYDFEKVYIELKKLFTLRKKYKSMPIKNIQDKIAEIRNYTLYDSMSVEEVEAAINQVTVTEKFKQAVLNTDTTDFLLKGQNSLTTGLDFPFPILSSVFKGIRKGETMAFAMPSNSGKSRFTIDIATYIAYKHKKKVLIVSNEMSEEKMKLCLITTIVNNKEIQELHGYKLRITEGEILEFKYKADQDKNVETDENGYVLRYENESLEKFTKRLLECSSQFRDVIAVTNWIQTQKDNQIFFVNITDHTNDELEKIILNYYYKEKIEYMFYDTLKPDTENIGNSEELKKTATILSNLAQNLNIFIGSSLQLTESDRSPLNLDVNDLAACRTVKEVLDTLCLIKQIHNEDLNKYEYSLEEVDTKFFDLKKYKDPDVRYYACVVDKNRAGAKPKVVFRLNLAYNEWEELGYLRLKQ